MIRKTKRIERLRLLTQLAATVLWSLPYFAVFGTQAYICPAFHCHGCPWSSFACPIGIISGFIALKLVPFVALSILGIVGAFGGRIVCGWACPFGLLQDLLGKLKKNKLVIPQWLGYTKYAVLVGLVVLVPLFYTMKSHFTFCGLCPAGTLEAAVPSLFTNPLPKSWLWIDIRLSILVITLLSVVFISRGFCRVICPLGAIFAVFNRISLFRFRLVRTSCNSCGSCAKTCPVDIDPVKDMNTEECIKCLDCTTTKCIKLGVK
jgi:polyferredoxin